MTLRNSKCRHQETASSTFFGQEDQMRYLLLPIEIQAKTQWGGLDFPHLLCTAAAVIIPEELELFSVVFSQLYLDL